LPSNHFGERACAVISNTGRKACVPARDFFLVQTRRGTPDFLSSCTSVSSGTAMKFTVEIRAAGALQTGERIFFVSSRPSTDSFSM
jgi:hypothetical protein